MADQIAYWNGASGDRWVREQDALDAMLGPFGRAALEAARVTAGQSVLDVGCGCGDTSLALASLVEPSGQVLGLDVSAPMLARARQRGAGHSNVSFLEGDAAHAEVGNDRFELLFSRFGVMFFPDPVSAFRHLHGALRADGRLAFVCWAPLADNPWARVPFEAAASVLGRPEPDVPDAPGPFSFGDQARVRRILEGAGYRHVTSESFTTPVAFGGRDDAARELARLGPVARLLLDRDEASVEKVLNAIRAVLPPATNAAGATEFDAAAWVVTAGA